MPEDDLPDCILSTCHEATAPYHRPHAALKPLTPPLRPDHCHCHCPQQGLLPRLMRIPPGQAIVWAVSDQVTGFFERRKMEELARSLPSAGRVS